MVEYLTFTKETNPQKIRILDQPIKGKIRRRPFGDSSFDLVISNGVLNLIPDKEATFAELARVLRREGALVAADLLVIETIPPDVLANVDAWST